MSASSSPVPHRGVTPGLPTNSGSFKAAERPEPTGVSLATPSAPPPTPRLGGRTERAHPLATLFDPQPGMGIGAGNARLEAGIAKIARRIRDDYAAMKFLPTQVVPLVRSVRDEIAKRHPQIDSDEPRFYLVWRVNEVLAEIGCDFTLRTEDLDKAPDPVEKPADAAVPPAPDLGSTPPAVQSGTSAVA